MELALLLVILDLIVGVFSLAILFYLSWLRYRGHMTITFTERKKDK